MNFNELLQDVLLFRRKKNILKYLLPQKVLKNYTSKMTSSKFTPKWLSALMWKEIQFSFSSIPERADLKLISHGFIVTSLWELFWFYLNASFYIQIDRLYQWKPQPMTDVQNTLKKQSQHTKSEFDERTSQVIVQLAEEVRISWAVSQVFF